MYLKRIKIENFKGHECCKIKFRRGFNLLIGDNGCGKTSILEAAAVALGGFITGIPDCGTRHFTRDEIRVVSSATGDGSYEQTLVTPVVVECTANIDGNDLTWVRQKSSAAASRSTVEPREIAKLAAKLVSDLDEELPVITYQSAARTWMQKREMSDNIKSKFNRSAGYKSCLENASDSKTLINWCARMEQVSWQRNKKIGEYESVKQALSRFISIMNEQDDEEAGYVIYDKRSSELCFCDNDSILPIRYLSAGYQSLIWMVLDIAYRMSVLNPNLRINAYRTKGIVLIDELDMHLHPKWQWNVINALKKTFPNVQFIAATHSPILVAACKKGNLIRVEQDNISYGETDYGLEINDVLTYTLGSLPIAKDVKRELDTFYDLLDNGDIGKAENILKKLKAKLGEEHPEVNRATTSLTFEKAVSEADE